MKRIKEIKQKLFGKIPRPFFKGYLRWLVFVMAWLLIISGFTFAGYTYYNHLRIQRFEGLVFPNIYLNDNNIGEVAINNFDNEFLNILERVNHNEVVFAFGEREFVYSYADLGARINESETAEQVINYIDNLSTRQKIDLIDGRIRKEFPLVLEFDEDYKKHVIRDMERQINVRKVEPVLRRNNTMAVEFIPGNDGKIFDTEANLELLAESLTTEDVIELQVETIERTRNIELLSTVDTKIAEHTTRFRPHTGDGFNIILAASRIDGTILMPGETFSFGRIAGAPYLRAQGYRLAEAFSAGEIVQAYGGGVCQVTSTLYIAQLRAGLQTVERHSHSMPVSYVPRGLDSMVAFKIADYRFKNNYNYPIFINAFTRDGSLTIQIWSNENATGGRRFEPRTRTVARNTYRAYLREYQGNQFVRSTFLHVSRYRDLPVRED